MCDEVVTKTVAVSWFDGFADAQLPGVADEIRNISFSSWRQKILIEIEIKMMQNLVCRNLHAFVWKKIFLADILLFKFIVTVCQHVIQPPL